ncbi:hypothetical protein ACLOJK_026508 [Asimina triloba]
MNYTRLAVSRSDALNPASNSLLNLLQNLDGSDFTIATHSAVLACWVDCGLRIADCFGDGPAVAARSRRRTAAAAHPPSCGILGRHGWLELEQWDGCAGFSDLASAQPDLMKRAVAKSCRWVSVSDLGPRGGAKIAIRAVILGGPLVAAGATPAMVDDLDSPIRQSCWRAARSWLDVICRWALDLPQINFVAADRSMVMIDGPPCLVGRADHRLGLGFGLPDVFAAAAKPIGMGRLPECVPIDLLLMGAGQTEVLLCHRWLLEDFKRAMGFLPEDEVAAGSDGAGFGQRAAGRKGRLPFMDGRCSSWLGDSMGDAEGDSVVAMVRSGWRLTEIPCSQPLLAMIRA